MARGIAGSPKVQRSGRHQRHPRSRAPHRPPTAGAEPRGREARNRFNIVFQDFIAVFATAAHPLAIFLDDLQWADGGSMSLLKLLLESPKSSHLMVIGAYRDNEVDETHTLALTLEELKANAASINTIHLGPLKLPEVTNLIADTLRQPADAVASLANLVIAKTHGKPILFNVFLAHCTVTGSSPTTMSTTAGAGISTR